MQKSALVTGASRGIGREIALQLARDGYAVTCFGRNAADTIATVELVKADGGDAQAINGDVTNADDLTRLVSAATEAYGRLDLLVNNAGIVIEKRAEDLTAAEFRTVIEVDLVACFAMSRAAYPALAREGGCIINIGSMFGSLGAGGAAGYCAAKAGVEGLTRALAVEWARHNIRVVCVAPGYVEVGVSRQALDDPKLEQHILRRIPLRRLVAASEVAATVSFLASPSAASMTGLVIPIDGGQIASI